MFRGFILAVLAGYLASYVMCTGPNGNWKLVSYKYKGEQSSILENLDVTLNFDDKGVSGFAGCNYYEADFMMDTIDTVPMTVFLGPMKWTTNNLCMAKGAAELEANYDDLMSKVKCITYNDNKLKLRSFDYMFKVNFEKLSDEEMVWVDVSP